MKKFVISATLVAAVSLASLTYAFSKNNLKGLSDIQLAAVEALSTNDIGGGDGTTCYNSITDKPNCTVLYCGTCTEIAGTPTLFSGTGTCPK